MEWKMKIKKGWWLTSPNDRSGGSRRTPWHLYGLLDTWYAEGLFWDFACAVWSLRLGMKLDEWLISLAVKVSIYKCPWGQSANHSPRLISHTILLYKFSVNHITLLFLAFLMPYSLSYLTAKEGRLRFSRDPPFSDSRCVRARVRVRSNCFCVQEKTLSMFTLRPAI